jgi:predicted transcriptional regulator
MSPKTSALSALSRRERQILNLLYKLEHATANQIMTALDENMSYSAVRGILRLLGEKDLVKHKYDGPRYVYSPVLSKKKASLSALKQVVETFFHGSAENTFAALLDKSSQNISNEELDRLAQLIDDARKEKK